MCLGLYAQVNNLICLVPNFAKYSILDLTKCLAIPLSQRSGRTVNDPRTPTLPQLAITKNTITVNQQSHHLLQLQRQHGLALKRVRTGSASPKNCIGSCRLRKVPNAKKKVNLQVKLHSKDSFYNLKYTYVFKQNM